MSSHEGDAKNDRYTDPQLRERLKTEVTDGDRGGRPGQWSARKAQLLAHEYEKACRSGPRRSGPPRTARTPTGRCGTRRRRPGTTSPPPSAARPTPPRPPAPFEDYDDPTADDVVHLLRDLASHDGEDESGAEQAIRDVVQLERAGKSRKTVLAAAERLLRQQ